MTKVEIDGTRFLINGKLTYEGIHYRDRPIEGLLFNSRMVQAIFDDENPQTASHWRYPDTGKWDPNRNADEFCAALPLYRKLGLLAVTVGLQGGGSIYYPAVYEYYVNSAFAADGSLKPAYFDRLGRVLAAAEAAGMVVIVNFFYWRQLDKLNGEAAIRRATEQATDWLLQTGHENILVDLMNEFTAGNGLLQSENIHQLIEIVQQTTLNGRRLLVSSSIHPNQGFQPTGRWQEVQDFYLPHGNDVWADGLRAGILQLKSTDAFRRNPRPVLVNEDSIYLDSLEAAIDVYASWGYYSQGYGCGGSWKHGRFDWLAQGRETSYLSLSGYQTVPVNWSINTEEKRAFFQRLAAITQGA